MTCTSEPLRIKSVNLIAGINAMVKNLRSVNAEIVNQQAANKASIEQLNATHEQTVAHLRADNEELEAQLQQNEAFCQSIDKLLSELPDLNA